MSAKAASGTTTSGNTFETRMSDLHKSYDDLMKKNFNLHNFFRFKYYSPQYDGIKFNSSFYERHNPAGTAAKTEASCTFRYANDFLETRNTLKTDGVVKVGLNFDLNRYFKNQSCHIDVETNYLLNKFAGKLRFLWRKERWNIKSSLSLGEKPYMGVKGVGLILNEPGRQIGVGTGLSFSLQEREFSIYNTTLWYHTKNAKLLVAHKTERDKFELGKLMAKVYNRLDDKTDIAMGLKHDYRKKSDKITLGVRYKQSETFTIKGKIDSKLNLRAAFELLLAPNLQLAITTKYDIGEKTNTTTGDSLPIALRLNFGDLS